MEREGLEGITMGEGEELGGMTAEKGRGLKG